MDNNKIFKCSYYNCYFNAFIKDYLSTGLRLPPINDEHKFDQILEGLLKTKLFCIKCSQNHATLICINSQIKIEN